MKHEVPHMAKQGILSCTSIVKQNLAVISLIFSILFVATLCAIFEPFWETNDDVSMSMIAHGYCFVTGGSSNILFSNVIWGALVRAIPEINGILGYSIATLSMLTVITTTIGYGLSRLGVNWLTSLSVILLLMVRPVLFPQFTIIAGLLMVSGLILLRLYAHKNDWRVLIFSCLLMFCSYLIRAEEFWFVLFIGLPLLPWRTLRSDRSLKCAILILISAITFSKAVNYHAYQGKEWSAYNTLSPARAPFTDYGAGELLKKNVDILNKHGFSKNDIDLISNWFFVDASIANPPILQLMLRELGPLPTQPGALAKAWIGVKSMFHSRLLIATLVGLLLVFLRPDKRIFATWGLYVLGVFALGLVGRPGVLRVYEPIVCLLVIAPFLRINNSVWKNRLITSIVFIAALFNMDNVISDSESSLIKAQIIQNQLPLLPEFPLVVWGGLFPFELAYPVIHIPSQLKLYQMHPLGSSTLAPFNIAHTEKRSFINMLTERKGISIMAVPVYFDMLDMYCKEHLHGKIKELATINVFGANYASIKQMRCEVKSKIS